MENSVYARLGARKIINGRGIYSTLGGAILSPRVWAAMTEANRSFVAMGELLEGSGREIARLVGAKAARVTLGASGAIALGVAACMTRGDSALLARVPDNSSMRAEVLIQRRHRYRYDNVIRVPGARLVEVGRAEGTTTEELAEAIGPKTAAVFFPAHLEESPDTVRLSKVVQIAHQYEVPVFVDAAYMIYPVDLMRALAVSADLVCFSSKYFGGPNAGGFICGQPEWVEAVGRADFVAFETGAYRVFGRAFKLDRHTVVGVVAALEEWLTTDHAARLRGYARRVQTIQSHLEGILGVTLSPMCFTMEETLEPEPVNCLQIGIGPTAGTDARAVDSALRGGSPAIHVHCRGDALIVDTEAMSDDEADYVGTRLKQELDR